MDLHDIDLRVIRETLAGGDVTHRLYEGTPACRVRLKVRYAQAPIDSHGIKLLTYEMVTQ